MNEEINEKGISKRDVGFFFGGIAVLGLLGGLACWLARKEKNIENAVQAAIEKSFAAKKTN
jgi:hypothetical protein